MAAAFLWIGIEAFRDDQFPPTSKAARSSRYVGTIARGHDARRIGAACVALSVAMGIWILRLFLWNRWKTLRWRRTATLLALGAYLAGIVTAFGPWHYGWAVLPTIALSVPLMAFLFAGRSVLKNVPSPKGRGRWAILPFLILVVGSVVRYGGIAIQAWGLGVFLALILLMHLWIFGFETRRQDFMAGR